MAGPAVASSCCDTPEAPARARPDLLLWSTLGLLVVACLAMPFLPESGAGIYGRLGAFAHAAAGTLAQVWWGITLGALFGGVLARVPQEIVIGLIGQGGTARGVLRASFSGVLLDLCSHGILLVAMRLYQRGASLGQTLAFLIASPWQPRAMPSPS
ncbi:MAG: permease [Gammaproteobacteria bacterium]